MRLGLFVVCLTAAGTLAADPPKIDRGIGKEPKYAGKPAYCLLAFDADAKHRVWLVHDGDTLYVDRNGNGDLTDDGEKVAAEKQTAEPADGSKSHQFEVGDVTVGGKTHKGLSVSGVSLSQYADGEVGKLEYVKAALKTDKDALCHRLMVEAERPGLKGGASGGRVQYLAGPFDLNGVLQFAAKPADAPVIHVGGPLEVSFYAESPTLRAGRGSEFMLCVGAPGYGPGTLAMVLYEDTIPKTAKPVAEVTFPAAKPGDKPVTEKVELKERC